MAALMRMRGISAYHKHRHDLSLLNLNLNESLCSGQLFKLRPMCSSAKFDDDDTSSFFSPPEPIPNRPLRDDSRRPSSVQQRKFQPRPSANFNRSGDQNRNQSQQNSFAEDFLKRFQLDYNEKISSSLANPPEENSADTSTAEAPPPPQNADELFKKMKENGLIPNAVAMLDGLCKDGLVQEAMKLFGLMREKGTLPEVVIYTAVIEGFCQANKYDDAMRVFRKMQSNGITPNAFTFSVLVQGLCKGMLLEDAFGVCLEMLEGGHSPNLATFIGLVDVYCKEKGLEDAKNMIQTLKQKGFYLDAKSVKEHLTKKGPFMPMVWEATLGKKPPSPPNLFE
ncbi:unnamed protein product [Cuscuta epithymum]|uniref:Pentatricopeptide repeat-containing protein n=1 Tax=Cuscuta epithymum TaxID=186058 RepID=A0AAV0CV54_9ASTE|nr:unnamed protein product [Cuscuta epithymum]CAH9148668.1 unnamed protein product [Cuscuta epithymum]